MRIFDALKAFVACSIFILVTPLAAQPVVNFIPQRHQNAFIFHSYDEGVAASQFEVLRALSRLPNATVFVEGLTVNLNDGPRTFVHSFELRSSVMPIQAFFGEDKYFLRKRFEDLTWIQKILLYEEGGARLAVDLGFVRELRATTTAQELESDLDWVRPEHERIERLPAEEREAARAEYVQTEPFQDRIVKGREFEVLKRLQDYVTSAEFHGENLAVVYGGYHQFNSAWKFRDTFEFNHTRACENAVIRLPAPENHLYMLMPDGSTKVF